MLKKYVFMIFVFIFSCTTKQEKSNFVLENTNKKLNYKNGILYIEDELFSGKITSFDAVNQTKNSCEYLNGKKHGKELKYFLDDSLAEERFYTNGLKTGIHKAWWNNSQPKFVYYFDNQGRYNGSVKEWYANGQPFKNFNFVNGKENGSQKMWQSNGKLRANFVTKNGERFGLIGLKKCYTVNTTNENYK